MDEPETVPRSLTTNTAFVTTGLALSVASLGLIALVTARVLGPSGRGALVIVVASVTLSGTLTSLGVNLAGRVHLVSTRAPVSLLQYLRISYALSGLCCVVAGTSAHFALSMAGRSSSAELTIVIAIYGGCYSLAVLSLDGLYGVGRPRVASFANGGGSLAQLLLVVMTLLLLSHELVLLVAAMALGSLGQAAGSVLTLHRADVAKRASDRPWRTLLHTGYPAMFWTLGQAGVLRVDRVILGGLSGASAVGIYSVAVTTTEWLWLVPIAFAQVLFHPIASGSSTASDLARARTRLLLGVGALVGIVFAIGPSLIELVFGSAYASAASPLRILLPGAFALSSYFVDAHMLAAQGSMKTVGKIAMFGLAAIVPLDFALITAAGENGAAAASTIVYTLMALAARRANRDSLHDFNEKSLTGGA